MKSEEIIALLQVLEHAKLVELKKEEKESTYRGADYNAYVRLQINISENILKSLRNIS